MRGRYYVQTLGATRRRLPPNLSRSEADRLLAERRFTLILNSEGPLGAARRLPPDLSGPEADYLLTELSRFIYSMTGEYPDYINNSRQGRAETIAYDLGFQKGFADRESSLTPVFLAWNENRRLPRDRQDYKESVQRDYEFGVVSGRNERERLRAARRR